MSGHSKWSTIKRQKGAADAKRGATFTKLSNAIAIAVKQGGGIADQESNFRLRLAVDRARAANMPKENIQRAIDRAQSGSGNAVEELLYEGFGPGGVALMIEAVSDNKQRTVADVKNIVEKNGGTLGGSGAVSYLFNRKGEIIVSKAQKDAEELMNIGIDAGVEDFEEEGDSVFFYVAPGSLQAVKKALESQNIEIESAQILYIPISESEQSVELRQKTMDLIEKLEDLDDVQQVYTNLKI